MESRYEELPSSYAPSTRLGPRGFRRLLYDGESVTETHGPAIRGLDLAEGRRSARCSCEGLKRPEGASRGIGIGDGQTRCSRGRRREFKPTRSGSSQGVDRGKP